MSIRNIETSEQLAQPVELFDIRISGLNLHLTSYNRNYEFENVMYEAMQIKRNELKVDTNSFDDRVKVTLPVRSNVGQRILNSDLESTTSLTITRTFVGITEKYIMWSGVIVQKEIDSQYLHLICLPTAYVLEKIGNRAQYTRVCRHVLYSANCGADRNLSASENQVTEVTSALLQMKNPVDDSYKGGIVLLANGVSRLILSVDSKANTITVINPFLGTIKGENVVLYKGCDKSIKCCTERFNNYENYGGFPFIPIRNIFSKSVV